MTVGFTLSAAHNTGTVFQTLKVGPWGQLPGLDIAPDGTKVVWTDVGGAYIYDTILTPNRWRQLVTSQTLPAGDFSTPTSTNINFLGGVWHVRIAYSSTNVLYMMTAHGYLYRSSDSGNSWTRTDYPQQSYDPNGFLKFFNQKLIVDPNQPNVVYAPAVNGVYFSNNGANFTLNGTLPAPTSGNWSSGLAFDTSGGTTTVGGQTRTANIFLTAFGFGVWRSTDGGQSFTPIADGAGLGGPTTVITAQTDTAGTYYCSDNTDLWIYKSGAWSSTVSAGVDVVATDPNMPGRLIVSNFGNGGKRIFQSLDSGVTFPTSWNGNGNNNFQISNGAGDMPAMQTSDTTFMTIGDMKFDPSTGLLGFAEGIGFWNGNIPTTQLHWTWTPQSLGIEELVANDVIAPLGGYPTVAVWDRNVFTRVDLSQYPSATTFGFNHAWDLDYASNDPNFICARMYSGNGNPADGSAYSDNKGVTWNLFAAKAAGTAQNGSIACAGSNTVLASGCTGANIVQIAGAGQQLYNTKDGGATWNVPSDVSAINGWINGAALCTHVLAADRINIGTFYAMDAIIVGGNLTNMNLWTSTNNGDNWTSQSANSIKTGAGFNMRLRAAPGNAGHLWFTTGNSTGTGVVPANQFLCVTTDAGATWKAVSVANGFGHDVKEVFDFGFGATKPGASYPTIFIVGWVDGTYGLWRSTDQAQSWIFLTTWPINNLDAIKVVNGDMSLYGRVYIGFSGTGFAYGNYITG